MVQGCPDERVVVQCDVAGNNIECITKTRPACRFELGSVAWVDQMEGEVGTQAFG